MAESALPKHFTPQDVEQKHYQRWEESGAFQAQPDSDKPPFCVMMPPPNVTGSLHVGHALNHIIQDVICRYKRRKGFDVLWQPGTDHASIAVHMVLENQLAKDGTDRFALGRDEFMKRAWEWKDFSHKNITTQLRRLGTTPDWSRERFTMDEGLSTAVLKIFVDLYQQGLVYRAERLVNWDPERQTVISDLEVNHKEVKGKLYHVAYPLEDGSGSISIATTRPETILADGAIAVHPDDEKYQHLIGRFAVVPVCNRIIPIIADEYVKSEFGSGAVKITAAHDFNDFEVYMRHKDKGIPLINLMNPDGTMNENCPEAYVGLDRFDARKKIIGDLDDLEYLEKVEDRKHQVPYGDRSGVVIEPYLTQQWFVDTPTLAKPAGDCVRDGSMKFVPKQYENMYFAWVDHQQPWCISRQLWWGHQIPAWYGPEGEIFVAETEEEALAQAEEKFGEPVELTRDDDVLDTWFSSALWAFSTLGWPEPTPELQKYYPTDVLVTGFDIITFWVSRMVFFSLPMMKEVPFKDVYIHALVRDEKGQKMSKSKGNVIDPLEMIDKYGCDALRFTILSFAGQGRDVRLSEQRIEGYRNFTTKIWNASRFCEMHECHYDPSFDPAKLQGPLNQWLLSHLKETERTVSEALEAYRFNDAASALYQFIWGTYCDWYLELIKPLLLEGSDKAALDETRSMAAWVLHQILHLLNPMMPYLSEELNERYFGSNDLMLQAAWPDYRALHSDAEAVSDIEWLVKLITEVRSLRADMNVPPAAKIRLEIKDASDRTKGCLDRYDPILRHMARLESVSLTDKVQKGAVQTVLDEATLILPIADLIDLDKERARLAKEIEKLSKEISGFEAKLGNEKFVANAPDDIVEEQRRKKADAEAVREKLSNALKQLEAA